ncbi:MAG: SDR family NAD(P)-dependent oxidoreductase [Actinomycetota bacterium]|nr:SDR family NAD(P)-dependent oxidoreductase [Actinomycetota bacterium]
MASPSSRDRIRAVAKAASGVPRNLPKPNPFRDRSLRAAVEGKTILITGASSGIGEATAIRVGANGAKVLLVSRTKEKLDAVKAEIEDSGGEAHVHPCDLTDTDAIGLMADDVLSAHGGVDILVNNAGRSIRRSIANSYDRIHDFERTIQLNYLGAVALILKLLPGMRERGFGHILNISSMGVQINTPRFSAYVASKNALDGFSRSIASEIVDDGVAITTVYMPLVRTPMIAPTSFYSSMPSISPEEASTMVAKAIVNRPKKQSTTGGRIAEITYSVAPKVQDAVINGAMKLFPGSGDRPEHRG